MTNRQTRRRPSRGVALIEATVGTFLLLFAALAAIQIVLYLHGELAAHAAASHMARTWALTRSQVEVEKDFAVQRFSSFGFLVWSYDKPCRTDQQPQMATCTVRVQVPAILPGAQLVDLRQLEATGAYPLPGRT